MSITNLREYGDIRNLKNDAKTLRDIFERQGINLIIDALSDNVGEIANKHDYTEKERVKIKISLVRNLNDALSERL